MPNERELPTEVGSIIGWHFDFQECSVGSAMLERRDGPDDLIWYVAGTGKEFTGADLPKNWQYIGKIESPHV